MSFTLTSSQPNPFDIQNKAGESLLSRLARLNLQPHSSERTLTQAIFLLCEAVGAPYGVIGRIDAVHGRVVTAARFGRDDKWQRVEQSIKAAAIREMISPSAGVVHQFEFKGKVGLLNGQGWTMPLIWQGELIGLLVFADGPPDFDEPSSKVTIKELEEAAAFIALIVINQLLSKEEQPSPPPIPDELREEIRMFSHDLRNPLSAIMSCTDLLVKQPALLNSDLLEQLLGTLQKSSLKALQLLNAFHNRTIY